MTDDINVSAPAAAQPVAAPASQPAPQTSLAVKDAIPAQTNQTATFEDFDENQIPESSRNNFRKYRDAQKQKYGTLESKLNEETRRRMEFEGRLSQFETQQRATQNQPEDPGPEPDYKNFGTIEEYRDALKIWQKKADAFEHNSKQKQQEQQNKAREESAKMDARGNAARAKYADFNQVIQPILSIANQIPALVQFIREFDSGTDVLYHLGKNPAVLEGLAKMQPFAAGQELLRMQAALSAPPVKSISQAPEPMTPVNTGGDGTVKSILEQVKKDDVSDFVARENRKEIRRRRGAE